MHDFIDWWTAPRSAAVAAAVGASAAVTAATSGVRTLRQTRRDSKSKSRPMVAAELRFVPYVPATQILVIRNYGPSIARNVRVTFDPEIPDPEDPSQSVTPFLKNRYSKTIPVLTPGMELDNIYYAARPGTGEQRWVNNEPTPEQVTVTITYENDAGAKFTDAFPLDTNLIRDRTYTESSGSPEAQVKVIAKSLKGMHDISKRAESAQRRAQFAPPPASEPAESDSEA